MDSTKRFSERVADYVRYRPGYPGAIVDDLISAGFLGKGAVIADVGSGTGLLSRLFLERGFRVLGVEPNAEMRLAGENELRSYSRFTSIAGAAEATTLPDASVSLVAAGQAFHWFDRERARAEFRRILSDARAGVVLVWNERKVAASPFLQKYEAMMKRWSPDYEKVDHRRVTDEVMAAFFAPGTMTLRSYANEQWFDWIGLRGRVMSSSYAPAAGMTGHEGMIGELQKIFSEHEREGKVVFEYETKVYVGRV